MGITVPRYLPRRRMRRLIDQYIYKLGVLGTAPGRGQVSPLGRSSVAAEVAANRWFNPLDSVAIDARIAAGGYWAWRSQALDNATWGPGPANYLASLISVEGGAVPLVEGNGVVPWAAATGWGCTVAPQKYFTTGIIPLSTNWSILVQQGGAIVAGGLVGCFDGLLPGRFLIQRHASATVRFGNGGQLATLPDMLPGNFAMIGSFAYRGGVLDGAIPGGLVPNLQIFIGAYNSSGIPVPITDTIQAVIICDDFTAIPLADRVAITALPAGSMHNL